MNGIISADRNITPVLGIDVGGTKVLSAVIDAYGNILADHATATRASEGFESTVASIVGCARGALEKSVMDPSGIVGVGLAVAGLIDSKQGIVRTSPNLPGWKDAPLGRRVAEALGKPVFMINDANAAAVGEQYFGAGRGSSHFVYVTVSTGIGGGLILDGKLYEGSEGFGGEIGHMVIDDKGPLCSCGNRGCWEMLASGKALEREARRSIEGGAVTTICSFCLPDPERSEGEGPPSHPFAYITAKAIHAAAKSGDPLTIELIDRTGYYLGVGLANIINIFNPELIVIGGGLSNMGDMLLRPAVEEAGRRAFRQSFDRVKFKIAGLGAASGVIGAAVHARQQMEHPQP
ncbi:glucokinase [Dehalogenimonas formicexedens]|uniref:Glucokinase n=1 Tax=Dehalogenimonas formicexedens TaxID=1839801 RepID=A0A1P8F7J8_9CHLR|nr:ROK family protein [Dehalogenimonas formicexedens]APV44430.1 glucokinase [Dehalogenimonas formicexedens]